MASFTTFFSPATNPEKKPDDDVVVVAGATTAGEVMGRAVTAVLVRGVACKMLAREMVVLRTTLRAKEDCMGGGCCMTLGGGDAATD